MSDQSDEQNDAAASRGASAANDGQSSGAGSSGAAGSGDNPQDGRDTGRSGESRPRGKTEDPDVTL